MNMRAAALTLAAVLVAAPAGAQRPTDVVRWTAAAPSTPVAPGQIAPVTIAAVVEPGWHLYAMTQPDGGPRPLEIRLAKGQAFTLEPTNIEAPLPKVEQDPNFNLETHYYAEQVALHVPVKPGAAVKPGRYAVSFEITFQTCSGRLCLRPWTESINTNITVGRLQKEKRK